MRVAVRPSVKNRDCDTLGPARGKVGRPLAAPVRSLGQR